MTLIGRLAAGLMVLGSGLITSPALAQDSGASYDSRLVLDLTRPDDEVDEDCDAQADAARIAGEIVVCRSTGETSDGYWDLESFEKDYAGRTQGARPPDVDGSGLILPTEGSIATITVTIVPGKGKGREPSHEVDFEALPEPPAQDQGSTGL